MQKWLCVHGFLGGCLWAFFQQIPKGDSAPKIMNKKQNDKPFEINSQDPNFFLSFFILHLHNHLSFSPFQSPSFLLSLHRTSDLGSCHTYFALSPIFLLCLCSFYPLCLCYLFPFSDTAKLRLNLRITFSKITPHTLILLSDWDWSLSLDHVLSSILALTTLYIIMYLCVSLLCHGLFSGRNRTLIYFFPTALQKCSMN